MRKLILLGGGGHCKACIDVIESQGAWEIAGILDPALDQGAYILDYPVLGSDDQLSRFVASDTDFLVTVGQIKTAAVRFALYQRILEAGGTLATIVSPQAYVSRHATIGTGSIVMHRAIVNASAVVGINSIINTAALVEHDAIIGDHSHIATASVINGGAHVGARSFVGSNATLHQGAVVADNAVIAAGSVVKRSKLDAGVAIPKSS
jgi:sugar O-acyltransferase (sialic acid O-acetyltransferase NeuD family)